MSSCLQFSLDAVKTRCASCSMHDLCLPRGLEDSEMAKLDMIISKRRRVPRNEVLYRMGDPFRNLYAIRVGHFKTLHSDASGMQQITGFQMSGELLGFDAISGDRHNCHAQALEDSEVCEIPFGQLEDLFHEIPNLQHHFHRMMSREITREQSIMLLLGNMRADQRLAAFLVNLSSRYGARGYSPTRFVLRMTREEIGNYLGLTIESVSRVLSKFKHNGVVDAHQREIELKDVPALKSIIAGTTQLA